MLPPSPSLSSYLSYGLNIESFIPLPGLPQTPAKPDVFVRAGVVRSSTFYTGFNTAGVVRRPEIKLSVRANKETFCFDWDLLACCLVEGGSTATVELVPAVDPSDFVPFITGPISAVLLHQRGWLVLHASVVAIDGRAVLFMGNKGYGKSTLAAHLEARGHYLVGDDLAPVSFDSGRPITVPGHPQLRLFPEAVASLGRNPTDYPQVNRGTAKRQFKPSLPFSTDTLEVACVFVLETGDALELSEMGSTVAFVEIAKNTYLHPYLKVTENTDSHFRQCNNLAGSVPVFKLSRPLDYTLMKEVTLLIEKRVSAISG